MRRGLPRPLATARHRDTAGLVVRARKATTTIRRSADSNEANKKRTRLSRASEGTRLLHKFVEVNVFSDFAIQARFMQFELNLKRVFEACLFSSARSVLLPKLVLFRFVSFRLPSFVIFYTRESSLRAIYSVELTGERIG